MTQPNPPTFKQLDYIALLKRKHKITDAAFDSYCTERFGAPLAELNKWRVSDLIDEMTAWEAVPASIRRSMGQLDLFGNEVAS